MSKHSHKSVAVAAPTMTTQKRGNVELFMECVDEDLAPSQKEAGRQAETQYKTAIEHVETATSTVNVCTSSAQQVTTLTAALTKSSVSSGRGRSHKPARGRGRPPSNTATATATGGVGVTADQGPLVTSRVTQGHRRSTRRTSITAAEGQQPQLLCTLNKLIGWMSDNVGFIYT